MASRASDSMPARGAPARYFRQAVKNISRTCSRVGSNILRLSLELAQIADDAARAIRLAREAHVAPVQDQPVVRVLEELGRGELQQSLLYGKDVLAWREAGPVGDAEDVRVDRHGRLAERGVQHDVGGLAPHARQLLQSLAVLR